MSDDHPKPSGDGETPPSPSSAPPNPGGKDVVREQLQQTRHAKWGGQVIEPLGMSDLERPLGSSELGEGGGPPAMEGLDAATFAGIDGYRIVREISRGGQAAVFQAVYEPTGREVAVKVMSGGPYITARSRERFEREVKILGALDHPGVVKVIDRGRTVDGSFFFSMDYVDGWQLDEYVDRLAREGSGVRAVVELFVKILDALEAAHQQGVVHRDLKPSNVRVDRRGEPRVLDFGLARLTDGDGDLEGRWQTRTNDVVGSLPWASPEQAGGKQDAMGATSDVYSLGVVLYHAVAGQWPYDVIGDFEEKVATIRRAEPRPLKGRAGPFGAVDAPLAGVVGRALRKAPRERFAGAGEMAEALRAWLRGEAVAYESPGQRRRRRTAVAYAVAGGVTLLALAAIVVELKVLRPAPPPTPAVPMMYRPGPVALPTHTNTLGMTFVELPAGEFRMGSPATEAGHDATEQLRRVTMSRRISMACLETTRGWYRQVMGLAALPREEGEDEALPVDHVSRADAEEFCRRLSAREPGAEYRLPTEAEWEFACRSETSLTPFDGTRLDDIGWYADNAHGKLQQVGKRLANPWGIYDMHGNVAELCGDDFVPFPNPDPQTDPFNVVRPSMAVIRGGNASASAKACRAAARQPVDPNVRLPRVGFRVVMVSPPTTRPAAGGSVAAK